MRRRDFIAGLGGAVAWPLVARAQQSAVPVIGFLCDFGESAFGPQIAAFRTGLTEQGFVEGRNVTIVYRWAESQYDRLPALASDLVRRRVAVIIATGGPNSAIAAKAATTIIPIVFANGGDPFELGLVTSLNRPGGNITGVSFLIRPLTAKRFEILHKIVPTAKSIGFFRNPDLPQFQNQAQLKDLETAAQILGLRLVIADASTPSEIEKAFAFFVGQRIDALLVGTDALFVTQRKQLLTWAARYAIPTMFANRDEVEAGGLVSYGANISDANRLAGAYAGRILKGENSGNLPMQQSTRIEMALNLRTAKALGLTVPDTLLISADEVIE